MNKKDEVVCKDGCKHKKSGAGKFILGAALGATLGVLFAPRKGSETRKQLMNKIKDLVDSIKEIDVDEVRFEIEEKIEEIKEELTDLDKEKVLKIAKQKGEQIKAKSEELVNLAIAKGTPVVQNAAEEVRQKAILVVKEVLDKLEKKDEK